ncbi:MAG TPA: tRNA (adenosine(37)-N6)-threonylcarbamoyltransferase complex transferase subunit TsaD [Spirochaetia bacterium]|nr:MAG: tRNA (adenosine(37)-N6)-threonylcarbamoyltransferase complex transferase subunit TsaD [Spirochaetes bacterium GWB1_36_13]HCL56110.1 tRNA (adenosine(37)-N6)-threonylcarbamoyltransferase complex transferase subunit TsaD [Spirochaetia bacterium]
MKILGIETSCDETSASVVEDGKKVLSNIIYSQIPFHQQFDGVVPEIASRKHLEWILPVIEKALLEAKTKWENIDAIAVTQEPGLMGSLLVGLTVAKTLSFSFQKPLIPVNHMMGHVYAANLSHEVEFPFIGLIVSGGHTLLTVWNDWTGYEIKGTTIDDAVGEAYDKTAKIMGLGYPGGPLIDKLFEKGDPLSVDLPLVLLNQDKDRYNFSYSGLKTAVVYYIQRNPDFNRENLAASFQKKAIDVLLRKTQILSKDTGIRKVVIAGGVAANSYLRKVFLESGLKVYLPSFSLCTDNAAMIAGLAYHQKEISNEDFYTLDARDKILSYKMKKEFRK